jgi:hypothetical protein
LGYRPTIGGLEKLQEFLDGYGFLLPNFYMDVRGSGRSESLPDEDISKKMISFDEAKRRYGAEAEVVDVRLANEDGSSYIQFSSPTNYGIFTALISKVLGMSVVVETHEDDLWLNRFLFRAPTNDGIFTALISKVIGVNFVVETRAKDVRLNRFLRSEEGSVFLDIAQCGKPEPSFMTS